jgi:hypothetical protein
LSFKIPRHPLNFFAGASRCGLCSQLRKHCSTCHSVFPCMLNLVPPPPICLCLSLALSASLYICLSLSLSLLLLPSLYLFRSLARFLARPLARSLSGASSCTLILCPSGSYSSATGERALRARACGASAGRWDGRTHGARTHVSCERGLLDVIRGEGGLGIIYESYIYTILY